MFIFSVAALAASPVQNSRLYKEAVLSAIVLSLSFFLSSSRNVLFFLLYLQSRNILSVPLVTSIAVVRPLVHVHVQVPVQVQIRVIAQVLLALPRASSRYRLDPVPLHYVASSNSLY